MRAAPRLAFTSSETLVVYQVVQNAVARLQKRAQGGSFTLRAAFLGSRDGREVRQMQWASGSSANSVIYATHDGRFLVRTGLVLRSYSRDYHETASVRLGPASECDAWTTEPVPPGKLFFAGTLRCDAAREKTLMDAETLTRIPRPTAANLAFWPSASYWFPSLATPPPNLNPMPTGKVTWEQMDKYNQRNAHPDEYCANRVFLGVPFSDFYQDDFPEYGVHCKNVEIYTQPWALWWHLHFPDHVGAVATNGKLLAVEIDHLPWAPLREGLAIKPLRIEVFNMAQKAGVCSLDLRKVPSSEEPLDFAVSPDGLLAVVIGNQLSVYKP